MKMDKIRKSTIQIILKSHKLDISAVYTKTAISQEPMQGAHLDRDKIMIDHPSSQSRSAKECLAYYVYTIATSRQAIDFSIVQGICWITLENYEHGNNIRRFLRMANPLDSTTLMPQLQMSTSSKSSIQVREEKQLDMLYKADSFVACKRDIHIKLG